MDSFVQTVTQILNLSRSCMQITAHTPTVLGVSTFGIPLDSERINSALKKSYWRVRVVNSTGSTQNDLSLLVRNKEESVGAVLVAEFQSTGRGRLDRSFTAEPGTALLFSFYITPSRPTSEWGWLPLLAGQALCAALESAAPANENRRLHLKWPNDILIGELKVAGLLSERIDADGQLGVVVGIGINVNATQEQLPVTTATSLLLQGFGECDRSTLLVAILEQMANYLKRWEAGDTSLMNEYRSKSATLGRSVRVDLPGGAIVESKAVSVAKSGALILANGSEITVGDVVHLYPK